MLVLTSAHPCSLYIKLFTLDPMWMLCSMSKGQHRASQSPNLEGSPLSATLLVADNLHFAMLSQLLLSGVCSSRVVALHPAHSACMTIQRGVPSAGAMRKSQFQWRPCGHPVCSFFMRYEGTSLANWHTTLHGSFFHWSFTFLFPL